MEGRKKQAVVAAGMLCAPLLMATSVQAALTLTFDYTYDTTGFFNDPARRAALTLAADDINRFTDHLAPIVQSGTDTWVGSVIRPDTGNPEYFDGSQISVPADVVRIYVGAKALGSTTLANTYQGQAWPDGSTTWQNTVNYRGTAGPLNGFGPWAASISFNPNFNWSFSTTTAPGATQYDFLTVASHELLHAMGFGMADSFVARESNGQFTGSAAMAVGSASNPILQLDSGGVHWAAGTQSKVAGVAGTALEDPYVYVGTRKRMTDLDKAAMTDVGWHAAIPGDANRDGVANSRDMLQIAAANSYGAGYGYGWSSGDYNGDGKVDAKDMLLVASTGSYGTTTTTSSTLVASQYSTGTVVTSAGATATVGDTTTTATTADATVQADPMASSATAILRYNPLTGDVTIDSSGLYLTAVVVDSASSSFSVGHTMFPAGSDSFRTDAPDEKAWFALATGLQGVFDFGNILPTGRSQAWLNGDLTFTYAVYGQSGEFTGNLVAEPVPLPAALWSGGVVLAGMLGGRTLRRPRRRAA